MFLFDFEPWLKNILRGQFYKYFLIMVGNMRNYTHILSPMVFHTLQPLLAHTPKHNGFAERRHKHIVETGLALLTHAKLPLFFDLMPSPLLLISLIEFPLQLLSMHLPF